MNAKALTLALGIAAVLTMVAVLSPRAAPEPVQAAAAVDYFLKIDGIDGESSDRGHGGGIDILAWSWGMSQSGSSPDDGSIVADSQELSLTKYVNKATPKLMLHLARGAHIGEAQLIVRKAGGDAKQTGYFIIHIERVVVTYVRTGGGGGEDWLTENVTLNFPAVKSSARLRTPKVQRGQKSSARS